MRKLLALFACSALELMTACSGEGGNTAPPVHVDLTCSLSVPVTQLVKKDSQVSVNIQTNCASVTVTSRGVAYAGGRTIPVQGSSINVDLSSLVGGDTVTFVGNIDGKPFTAPTSIALITAVPVSLEFVYDGPTTVVTGSQVKFRLKRDGAINCSDALQGMPVLPDSAASVPRLIRDASDSNVVTLDVGTIVGTPGYTMTCSGNDGSSMTRTLSFKVATMTLTAADVHITPGWVPAVHNGIEIHFYSKCGFASGAGAGLYPDAGRNWGSMVGHSAGPASTKYYNCSHISTFSSGSSSDPNGFKVPVWLYQQGRDSVFIGTFQQGGPQP